MWNGSVISGVWIRCFIYFFIAETKKNEETRLNFEEGNECENGDQQEKKGRWQQNHTGIAEVELEELRRKIKRNIETECTELEKILDSEKPSIYGQNRRTYDDIIELIVYLRNFKFSVENEG